MPKEARWPPAIKLHRQSGRARIRHLGDDYYLGPYGSAEASAAYAELLRRYPTRPDGPLDLPGSRSRQVQAAPALTVAEAACRYLTHATAYYRDPDGHATGEMGYVREAVTALASCAGRLKVAEFGIRHFRDVRQAMIAKGWCRENVNHHVNVVRRIFRWLAQEELCPASVWEALRTVEPLKAGRTQAPERPPVRAPEMAWVEAVLPLLTPHLGLAARLQLATACRPGEAMRLSPADIELAAGVWLWRPRRHKTIHLGKERLILIGPRGQRVLGELLRVTCGLCGRSGRGHALAWQAGLCGTCRDWAEQHGVMGPWRHLLDLSDYPAFHPGESEVERARLARLAARSPRRTPLLPGRRFRGERFSVEAYTKAIHRACDRAGVPRWSAHKLRHLASRTLAAAYGPLVAQTILGHGSLRVTEIYTGRDLDAAAAAVAALG